MPLRLPPLPALRQFEAAGRLLSFKRAAAELNLTPSALSHAIVGLEDALGTKLFVRGARGLSLTPGGADYLAYVSEALSLIAVGTQRLPDRRAERTVSISAAPGFAARWLVPRLPRFTARYPRVGITLDTSHRQVGFPGDGFDFAIRMSRAAGQGLDWAKLVQEEFVPVCSPAYRARLAGEDGAIDWSGATLIHLTTTSEGWQNWFDATGVGGIEISGGLRFDTIELAFGAAAAGIGVALGRCPLVDRELESGVLVALTDRRIAAETAYWLVAAEGADRRPELRGFRRWLVAEADRG